MGDRIPQPNDAMDFLRRKKIVPTESWKDMVWGEHSHAFTVAHSMGADILEDIFKALKKCQSEGLTLRDFKKELIPIMKEKGWYGRADEPDGGKSRDKGKKTGGKGTYTGWRLETIYRVNMATAASAGRYRQMLRCADRRPFWQYLAVMDKRTREEHKTLNGKVFAWDDPFWEMYDPPNGWRCRCGKQSLTADDVKRKGLEVERTVDGELPDLGIDWEKAAPPEWRYSPGREALAPDFKSCEYLKAYTMADGRKAVDVVREAYRRDLQATRISKEEYKTWTEKDDRGFLALVAVLPRETPADYKIMMPDTVASLADPRAVWECLNNPDRFWEEDGSFWMEKRGLKIRLSRRDMTSLKVEEVINGR